MDKTYRETKASLMQLNDLLGKLEMAFEANTIESIKQQVSDKIDEITNFCDQLDLCVSREPAARRYDSRMKVDQLKYDFNHYRSAYNAINARKEQRLREEKRREELLNMSLGENKNRPNQEHILNLESEQGELRHHNRLARSNDEMDRMIEHGENVLGSIKGQSEMLKGVKSKMLNVGNALGLSRTLIKMIDRRSVSDRYLLVIGMIVTCIIMFLTVKFLI